MLIHARAYLSAKVDLVQRRARPVRSRRRRIVSGIGDDFHTETDKHKRSEDQGGKRKGIGED